MMTPKFETIGLQGGVWRGILQADQPHDRIALTIWGQVIAVALVQPAEEGQWQVTVSIPPDMLADGVQTYILIADSGQGNEAPQPGALRLGHMPLIAGSALDQDLLAEIALLKAEVELLKREFRRVASSVG